jgi:hypothetical protein
MTKMIFKSTLLGAILLFGAASAQATLANLAPGTQIQLKTAQVGKQIVGISNDGVFAAIICNSSNSADLLFSNPAGDIVTKDYNSSTLRRSAWAPERSPYIGLTSAAAEEVCANPNGNYVFEAVADKDTQKLGVKASRSEARYFEAPRAGEKIQVRTGQVGNKVMAVTNDGKFFAIKCAHGLFAKSSGDFIYSNRNGKIVVHDYKIEGISMSIAPVERAAYWPMTNHAVVEVCNYPNGIYTLQINAGAGGNEVEYLSGQRFEANSRLRSRGF